MTDSDILRNIQSSLYLSELSYRALQETLAGSGEIRAWYKASRKELEHKNSYREVNWFLTDMVLVRQEINLREIFFVSFCLKEISRLERFYDIKSDPQAAIVLRRIVINFNDGKSCDLSIPLPQFQGDVKGFNKLVGLL